MEDVASTRGALRFSTDDVAPSERLPYLREVLGHAVTRLDLSAIDGRPLKWAARLHPFDGLTITSGQGAGVLSCRSRALLADGSDDLLLHINRSGSGLASQVGRECRVDAGSAVLFSTTEIAAYACPEPTSWLTLRIPRRRLTDLCGTPEDALARPIPAATEALRLLVDYVDITLRRDPPASPQLCQLFATHVRDLVALTIGAARDATEVARGRGLGAARLDAAKGEIACRLNEESLTIGDIARRLGVTPRYVQRLFESEGTTFTEYVTRQRLARAHRLLSDPRFLGRTVTTIAFDVGFSNLSHFNRSFRRSYGATPSEIRASARSSVH